MKCCYCRHLRVLNADMMWCELASLFTKPFPTLEVNERWFQGEDEEGGPTISSEASGSPAPPPAWSSCPATKTNSRSRSTGPWSKQPGFRLCSLCIFHLRWEVKQDKLSFKEAPGQASWVWEHFFRIKFFSIRFLKDEGFLRQTLIYETLNKFNTKYKHNPQPMCMEEAGEHPVSRAGSNPQARTTGQLCTLLGSPPDVLLTPSRHFCGPVFLFLSRYQQPGPWKTSWGINHVLFQRCMNCSLLLDSFRKRNRRLGKTSVMLI